MSIKNQNDKGKKMKVKIGKETYVSNISKDAVKLDLNNYSCSRLIAIASEVQAVLHNRGLEICIEKDGEMWCQVRYKLTKEQWLDVEHRARRDTTMEIIKYYGKRPEDSDTEESNHGRYFKTVADRQRYWDTEWEHMYQDKRRLYCLQAEGWEVRCLPCACCGDPSSYVVINDPIQNKITGNSEGHMCRGCYYYYKYDVIPTIKPEDGIPWDEQPVLKMEKRMDEYIKEI